MEVCEITVTDAALRKGAEEGMDGFLQVFIDKYLEVTGGEINIYAAWASPLFVK